MTHPVHASFDVSRTVLETVARQLESDNALRHAGVTLAIARGAEGRHIERVTLQSANGTFELLAKDTGIYLGSLREWPVHQGDELHPERAVGYRTALLRAEATGTAFHRVSVQNFTADGQ